MLEPFLAQFLSFLYQNDFSDLPLMVSFQAVKRGSEVNFTCFKGKLLTIVRNLAVFLHQLPDAGEHAFNQDVVVQLSNLQ